MPNDNAFFNAMNFVTTLAANVEPAYNEKTLATILKAQKAKKALNKAWEDALCYAEECWEAGRDAADACVEANDCGTAVAYGAEANRLLKEARDLYNSGLSNWEFASQFAGFCEERIIKVAAHLNCLCNND